MEKKKDLRVQKTYSALMAAFEALMAEETFDDITVNELCARALIRRPTFYSHFEDKYDFLRFYLNEIQWQIESEADAATDLPVEHFQRSWRALIAFIDEHPALIRMGLRSKSLPIIFEILSLITRRSISSFFSPGPLVPIPPPSLDRESRIPTSLVARNLSCASSTCSFPS